MEHWSDREGDGHAEQWAESRSPLQCIGYCHMPAHHIHSFAETEAVECTRRFVVLVEQKATDCLDHSIFAEERQMRWNLVLVLVVERKEATPVGNSEISKHSQLHRECAGFRLTELSNLARFLRFPSTMLVVLISALANCSLLALRELVTEPAPPSLLLYPLMASLLISSI